MFFLTCIFFEQNKQNQPAARAIYYIKQKLKGMEFGESLSTEGQVNHLIEEAINPLNLCQMYSGWQAWI